MAHKPRFLLRMVLIALAACATIASAQDTPVVSTIIMHDILSDHLATLGFTPPPNTGLQITDYLTFEPNSQRVHLAVDKNPQEQRGATPTASTACTMG